MSTEKTQNLLPHAVRQLRESLGESQMTFANRFGWHIVTLARYETTRPPKGRALAQLWHAAYEHGEHKLARVFLKGLQADVGEVVFAAPKGFEAAVDAFIYVLGHPKLMEKREKLLKLLEPEIERMTVTQAVAKLVMHDVKALSKKKRKKP